MKKREYTLSNWKLGIQEIFGEIIISISLAYSPVVYVDISSKKLILADITKSYEIPFAYIDELYRDLISRGHHELDLDDINGDTYLQTIDGMKILVKRSDNYTFLLFAFDGLGFAIDSNVYSYLSCDGYIISVPIRSLYTMVIENGGSSPSPSLFFVDRTREELGRI